MKCEHSSAELSHYLDGEVDEQQRRELEERLRTCPHCRDELEQLRQADAVLLEASRELVSAGRSRADVVIGQVRRLRSRRRVFRAGFAAAALLFLGFAGYTGYLFTLTASPQEVLVFAGNTWAAGTSGLVRVLVSEAEAKQPVEDALVRLLLKDEDGNELAQAEGRTDSHGSACIPVSIPDMPEQSLRLSLSVESEAGTDELTRSIQVTRPARILVTTDKPLYQPTQTIHIRALAMNNFTQTPLGSEELSFEIVDPNGNKLFRKKDTTSEFGLASVDFQLADEVTFGDYRIQATAGGVSSERTVQVKRYQLPKFELELGLDQEFYQPGNTLKGTLSAQYLFKKPIVNARVRIELSTFVADGFKMLEVLNDLKTDEEGFVSFETTLPGVFHGTELEQGNALLRVEAHVRDTADHEESKTVVRVVSREPFEVQVVPESGDLIHGIENTVYMVASYPDGRPAPATLHIEGADYETDELGILEYRLRRGQYQLIFEAYDVKGFHVWGKVNLSRYGGLHDASGFIIRTDRLAYQTGETMTIDALCAFKGGALYLDVVRNQQTIVTKSIDVREGRGRLEFDIPADMIGTLQVSAYHVGRRGRISRDTRVVVVGLPEGLQVRPKLRQETHRPGEEIPVDFEVLDSEGRPIQAALSLSVVDEAVFLLSESRPGMEKTYFAIEEDLLEPRWQLKKCELLTAPPIPEPEAPPGPTIAARVRSSLISPALQNQLAEVDYFSKRQSLKQRRQAFIESSWRVARWPARILVVILAILGFIRTSALFKRKPGEAQGIAYILVMLIIFSGLILAVESQSRYSRSDAIGAALFWLFAYFVVIAGWAGLLKLASQGTIKRAPLHMTMTVATTILLIGVILSLMTPRLIKKARREFRKKLGDTGFEAALRTAPQDKGDFLSRAASEPPRIREYFPETLYWNPEVITDESGKASVTFPAADSITTWRLSAGAVSRNGALGAAEMGLTVFQSFFVDVDFPLSLTQGDEVSVPIQVYNYLKTGQNVRLAFEADPGLELLDPAETELALEAEEVTSIYLRIRAKDFGHQKLVVWAYGSELSDAIRRGVDVLPDGKAIPVSLSDVLQQKASARVDLPQEAIDGASALWVHLYPSTFSEIVRGLESLVRLPYG